MFAALIIFLTAFANGALCARSPQLRNIVQRAEDLQADYDFIVVGGGASGLTVADRLTENPNASVLVLEYGSFDSHEDAVLVPGLLNLTSTPYWFNLTSTPQLHLQNRSFQVTIAAAVGGGTCINGMLFHRGARADYDAWEELGAKGWNWDSLLPYFYKSENFTPTSSQFADEWEIKFDKDVHGSQGPIQASYPPYQFPVVKNFFHAFHGLGIPTPRDPNDGSAQGVFWAPSTLDPETKTRSYARVAHYDRAVQQRSNYHVLPMAAVTKIMLDDHKRATGVEYLARNTGKTHTICAKKEVILAAGAVHTPQILMLSGIGDPKDLASLDINIVSELPAVGHNFQDHPTMFFINQFQNDLTPNADDLVRNKTFRDEQLALYRNQRQGAFTIVANGGNTVAFVPLPNITASAASIITSAAAENLTQLYPDAPPSVFQGYRAQRSSLLQNARESRIAIQETAFNGGFMPLTLLHPLSRGRISINTTTHLAPPLVDYRTLSSPTDLAIFREILRFNRKLLLQVPLAPLQPIELVPGSNVTSETDMDNVLPGIVGPTFQHPCCTCPMVARENGGVVNPETLEVYGVYGLSIVDASLWPLIPGAHLMGSVYAVAERAADLIKERWNM
ncbi:GMC oxidoreductase [Periconia macrospinosa]|uniref:GMC oxidoreductase n=1 Tax=Periconia macrospinosa TaxID=97972 RepID=A0A2V1DFK6_9PLEO|nr:GMC oxidoreductase [Periconia macrospinosa]